MTKLTYLDEEHAWGLVNGQAAVVRTYHDERAAEADYERLAAGPMRRQLAVVPAASDWLDGFRAGYLEGIRRRDDTWLKERIQCYADARDQNTARFHIQSLEPFEFRYWVLGVLGVRPDVSPDRTVDGRLYFYDEGLSGPPKQILIAVTPGSASASDVLNLESALQRYSAQIGAILTGAEPSEAVFEAARGAGPYVSPWSGDSYPRIQVLSVMALLEGQSLQYPRVRDASVSAAGPELQSQPGLETQSAMPAEVRLDGHHPAEVAAGEYGRFPTLRPREVQPSSPAEVHWP